MSRSPGADRRVIGRYEILRELGSGAMATVHLARQSGLNRAVALKELNRIGLTESPVTASRFLREARLAGSLSHTNIVTVFDYFEYEGRPYIAMEYVPGGSLRERVEDLSLSQVIGVLDGVLAALTHAEMHGIVHRDIKPENILVTADGRVKIADFGIAKAHTLMGGESLTVTGGTIGTPMYMAPEQATGGPISIATDLYAVGIVAFEMLLGYVPFGSGDSPLAILWQHVNEPVPDARALRPDLDPGLLRWMEGLLAKDPADRPASAAQVVEALEEIALEHLGSRWRREAALPARAVELADRPAPDAPAPPSRPSDHGVTHASNAGLAATRDAGARVAPPVVLEQIEHDSRPVPPASVPSRARWTAKGAALVALASLAAAAGGYLAFESGDSPPDDRPSVAAARFATGLGRTMDALERKRLRERQLLRDAVTAREQAARAAAIGAAYRTALADIRRLDPAARQRAAASRLLAELVRGGAAYDALARALSAQRRTQYDRQSEAVVVQDAAVLRAAAAILDPGDS